MSVVSAQPQPANLLQFWEIIKCTIPNSRPLDQYNGYGCYCGFGGSGTPMDDLDKCCQIHDSCYEEYRKIETCDKIFDNPYTEFYYYSCSDNTVTCTSENNPCKRHICECDRKAAVCFSQASYNELHKDLDKNKYCQ
ncbi:phospholipase A2-like isoform X2 [Mixophyes fleayi]|uniref:phospholipase A2-like isoform X2 n=1 Tax=Mixophyes fleayi TaxID=3061075 RepID=UPI003F4DE374